ncbi:32567_t:CDS:10 [Gigaspora margarita]|uniref:32567_t:CDS:1 n=1 Tax=Gigaspora margarita TaxID=4874 RepID=A0ABM8VWK5_GIGMA|nr:32567_t:CDS:10 [Gigaspora margarita]
MEKEKAKYYLGLDIGIGSVVSEESKNKKSLAEKRREFRGQRRLLNRWHRRKKDLKRVFRKIFGNDFFQASERFAKNSTNLLEYDETKFFNPYVIRYRALSNKIELTELFHILFHISKYRGYKEFYLDNSPEEKDKETEKEYAAVRETKKLFQENNYGSAAEMVIKNEKFRHSQHKNLLSAHNHNPDKDYKNKEEIKKNHKHFIFPREKLEEEVRKILIEQSKHYSQLPKIFEKSLEINKIRETRTNIEKIIFRQRDFEDGPTKFSKISNLGERELGGIEKVKEIHRQVFEWLLFPAEEFLNKLVGKGNWSFPKGIEFETDFLDCLKENSTVFYQIGQIIFEKITPQRRKKELDNLSQKNSLDAFQDCLDKLEKYDKKSVINGQKYGEFQAEAKKENPVVFRSFNQTRKILKNLFQRYPGGFATINIETGRDLWNSEEERSKIERKNQDQAQEKRDIVEKLRDSNSDIQINEENIKRYPGRKRKKKPTIRETNSGGICLYCGQEIDVLKLKNTEIDHIIPQKAELEDFVSRNLNDTRMIATYLKRYVRNELDKKAEYQKTEVQSIKDQLRSLTPYHHAIDAIVLAHFKSRGYIQLLEDLTKISQKLKKHELLDEYTQNAIGILESAIQQKEEEEKEIKEVIIKVEKVLSESEYYERVKDGRDQKVKKDFVASEQAGYRKRGEKILPELCEKLRNKEKLDLPKNISLSELVKKMDTSKYAGFGVGKEDKTKKVKNIVLLSKKESDNLENELKGLIGLPLFYTGTTLDNVSSINIVGLVYDNKENLQTIYPEHGDKIIKVKNIVNSLGTGSKSIKKISPLIKLLKIDILVRENDELKLNNNQFTLISRKENTKLQFSFDDINCIILENSHSLITSHLLSKLAENNISLIVTNEKYDPTGLLISLNRHFSPLSVENGDKTNREGAVAKYLFQKLYGKDFVRFADDSINGALNYGYKILTSALSRTIASYGLNNHLGIKHCGPTNWFNLKNNLSSQTREEIAKIIYYPVKINNLKTKIYTAIDIMIKSFISCLKENRVGKIKLPTLLCQELENEEENRKDFRYFHKYLLGNGYYMLQFSVYVKLCHTFDYAQETAQKLEKNCPKIGNIRYFLITEKQFRNMKMIVGKETKQEKVKNIDYLTVL